MTGTEPVLAVEGLGHRYLDRQVLGEVSFTIAPGAALALVGPNGVGKTTVLRSVVGAIQPTTGSLRLLGEPIDERRPQVRRTVASLLDDLEFFADLTAAEHLDLLARAHGDGTPEDLVDDLLDDVGLGHAADQLPGSMSSGQRRRLALATVFVRPRRLLVLDEPEQRLDVDGVAWLADRLNAEKAAGVALLFASHDPALVEAVADDVLTLDPLP